MVFFQHARIEAQNSPVAPKSHTAQGPRYISTLNQCRSISPQHNKDGTGHCSRRSKQDAQPTIHASCPSPVGGVEARILDLFSQALSYLQHSPLSGAGATYSATKGVYAVHILKSGKQLSISKNDEHRRNAPSFRCPKCCDRKSNMRPAQRFGSSPADLRWERGSARFCDLCDKTTLYCTCTQYKQDMALTLVRFRLEARISATLFHPRSPNQRGTRCPLAA